MPVGKIPASVAKTITSITARRPEDKNGKKPTITVDEGRSLGLDLAKKLANPNLKPKDRAKLEGELNGLVARIEKGELQGQVSKFNPYSPGEPQDGYEIGNSLKEIRELVKALNSQKALPQDGLQKQLALFDTIARVSWVTGRGIGVEEDKVLNQFFNASVRQLSSPEQKAEYAWHCRNLLSSLEESGKSEWRNWASGEVEQYRGVAATTQDCLDRQIKILEKQGVDTSRFDSYGDEEPGWL